MTTRTTERELQHLVDHLNNITGQPAAPYGDHGANVGNYHLDFAYGGVTLHQMMNTSGGVTTPLGLGYSTKRELADKLRAFISGILVEL